MDGENCTCCTCGSQCVVSGKLGGMSAHGRIHVEDFVTGGFILSEVKRGLGRDFFCGQVKEHKSFSSKETQIWATKGKEIRAKENNRRRLWLVQRKDEG